MVFMVFVFVLTAVNRAGVYKLVLLHHSASSVATVSSTVSSTACDHCDVACMCTLGRTLILMETSLKSTDLQASDTVTLCVPNCKADLRASVLLSPISPSDIDLQCTWSTSINGNCYIRQWKIQRCGAHRFRHRNFKSIVFSIERRLQTSVCTDTQTLSCPYVVFCGSYWCFFTMSRAQPKRGQPLDTPTTQHWLVHRRHKQARCDAYSHACWIHTTRRPGWSRQPLPLRSEPLN